MDLNRLITKINLLVDKLHWCISEGGETGVEKVGDFYVLFN